MGLQWDYGGRKGTGEGGQGKEEFRTGQEWGLNLNLKLRVRDCGGHMVSHPGGGVW